jgi:hypothetical protein
MGILAQYPLLTHYLQSYQLYPLPTIIPTSPITNNHTNFTHYQQSYPLHPLPTIIPTSPITNNHTPSKQILINIMNLAERKKVQCSTFFKHEPSLKRCNALRVAPFPNNFTHYQQSYCLHLLIDSTRVGH